ncbi:BNR-4 repeat-containing protein [Pelagicoccus enzymogenes]|uniref:BNR-4 repeat-containing protein n=1 Tax=Pelagicoccus enzymogenes TaxID=2773457 RepID=UPI0028110F16|nr:BNR-4 repeat-containing protein [Pelagicoccus enzymogenes]
MIKKALSVVAMATLSATTSLAVDAGSAHVDPIDASAQLFPNGVREFSYSSISAAHQQNAVLLAGPYVYIVYYDEDGSLVVARRSASDTTDTWLKSEFSPSHDSTDPDSHRTANIAASPSDGRLHIIWGLHADRLRYVVTKDPNAVDATDADFGANLFEPEQAFLAPGEELTRVCYPRMFVGKDGKLQVVWRDDGGSGNADSFIATYNGDKTWTPRTRIVNGKIGDYTDPDSTNNGQPGNSNRNAYFNDIGHRNGKTHVSWTWRENAGSENGFVTNHDLHYAYSADGGNTWFNRLDSQVAGAMSLDSPDLKFKDVPYAKKVNNQSGQAIDSDGGVHMLFRHLNDADQTRMFHYYKAEGSTAIIENELSASSSIRPKIYADPTNDAQNTLYIVTIAANQLRVYGANKGTDNWGTWETIYDSGSAPYLNATAQISDSGDQLFILAQRRPSDLDTATSSALELITLPISPTTIESPEIRPEVAFVSPADDLDVTTGYSLSVEANASDADGTITSVALYIDGILVRELASAPYIWGQAGTAHEYELTGLDDGTYDVEVIATDNDGLTAATAFSLTVQGSPLPFGAVEYTILDASITASSEKTTDPTRLAQDANDNDDSTRWNSVGNGTGQWLELDFGAVRTLRSVRIKEAFDRIDEYLLDYWDGSAWQQAAAGRDPSDPQIIPLPNLQTNKLRFTAVSLKAGITSSISLWDFSVNALAYAPDIELVDPTGNTEIEEGEPFSVEANVGDLDGDLTGVSLFVDDVLVREIAIDPFLWGQAGTVNEDELGGLAAGTYVIKIVATDNRGLTSELSFDLLVKVPLPAGSEEYLVTDATISASSQKPGVEAAFANDGDDTTRWNSNTPGPGQWIQLDFAEEKTISSVRIVEAFDRIGDYLIEYWDGSAWQTAATGYDPSDDQTVPLPSIATSKIRFTAVNLKGGSTSSISLFTFSATAVNAGPAPEPAFVGWDDWTDTDADLEVGLTGTVPELHASWKQEFRAGSKDGTFGSLPTELAAADLTHGQDPSLHYTGYRSSGSGARSVDFMVTEANGVDIDLTGFHFDAIARGGAADGPYPWTLEVLEGGALTAGQVASGILANGRDTNTLADVDVDLSSLADATLEASSSATFRLTFESSDSRHFELDNVAISSVPETADSGDSGNGDSGNSNSGSGGSGNDGSTPPDGGGSGEVTFVSETKISDEVMFFNGNKVALSHSANNPDGYDYVYGRTLTPHGDCIQTYKQFVFMSWYRGGENDRHVMLTRLNTETGVMKTIEFPHQHTGYKGKWWIGETHNTIAVGICPKDETVHLVYDMHRNGHGGANPDDYLRYSYTVAGAATVADDEFSIDQFVNSEAGHYKHLRFPGITDDASTKLLTYPGFFTNDQGELLMKNRHGFSENGKQLLARYDGEGQWHGYYSFNNSQQAGKPSPIEGKDTVAYNWNPYGDYKFLNGKIRVAFQRRENNRTDKYKYQNGIYYAYSDDPAGVNQWKDANGNPLQTPIYDADLVLIAEPGDWVQTTQTDKAYMVGGFDFTVTDAGDEHFVSQIRDDEFGFTKKLHTYRAAGDTEFTTVEYNAGSELYAAGNDVFVIGLKDGRVNIVKTAGGTSDFQEVYQGTTGPTFDKGIVHVEDGKAYYYLKETGNNGDKCTTYLQVFDLGITGSGSGSGDDVPDPDEVEPTGLVALNESTTVTDDALFFWKADDPKPYHYGAAINPHGNCVKVVNGYVFYTWYRGGFSDRALMVSRKKIGEGDWVHVELPGKLSLVGGKGDTHLTTNIGVCPIDGTIHIMYDHHNEDLNYIVSAKNVAFAPDAEFTAANFLPQRDYLVPGKKVTGVTYPKLINNDQGELFFERRLGSAVGGNMMISYYDGNAWSDEKMIIQGTGADVTQGERNYAYGAPYLLNGDFHYVYSVRWAESPTRINEGVYIVNLGPRMDGAATTIDGKSYDLPIIDHAPFLIADPRSVPTTEGWSGGPQAAVSPKNDLYLRVNPKGTDDFTYLRTAGESEFSVFRAKGAIGEFYGNRMYKVNTNGGKLSVQSTLAGELDWRTDFAIDTGINVQKSQVQMEDGKIVAVFAEKEASDEVTIHCYVFDINKTDYADQSIAFDPLPNKIESADDFELTASSTSGLPVSFESSDPNIARIVDGNKVQIMGVGTCSIIASQAGDGEFDAAANVVRSLTITPDASKSNQSISFTLPVSEYVWDSGNIGLSANASSGLPVVFESTDTEVAEVVGNSVVVKRAGKTTINALQLGNGTYNAAPIVGHELTVPKRVQVITFDPIPTKESGDAEFTLQVSSNNPNAKLRYVAPNNQVAVVWSNIVRHLLGPGTATITVSDEGDDYFLPAQASQTLTVNPKTHVLPKTIEAEHFTSKSSATKVTRWSNSIFYLNAFSPGKYAEYTVDAPNAGTYTVEVRTAAPTTGSKLKISQGSTTLADINLTKSPSLTVFRTSTAEITLSKGVQTIKVASTAGSYNFDSLKISGTGTPPGDDTPSEGDPQEGVSVASVDAEQSPNVAANLFDGNTGDDYRWSAQVYPKSVVLDYSEPRSIEGVKVFTYQGRAYHYTVELSNSPTDGFVEVASRTGAGTAPFEHSFAPTEAQYLRLTVTGATGYSNDWVSINEIQIIETPEDNGGDGGSGQTITDATITASSAKTPNADGDGPVELANDGDDLTRWNSVGNGTGQWLQLDFGTEKTITSVRIKEAFDRIDAYLIEYWDGTAWQTAASGNDPSDDEIIPLANILTSKIRFTAVSLKGGSSSSISVFTFSATEAVSNPDDGNPDNGNPDDDGPTTLPLVTLQSETHITDKALFFDGGQVGSSSASNSADDYDYKFGNTITPHGDCIKTYKHYVFMTWYRGGKEDRHVMLTRLNTQTGSMATIEFPHRHNGYQNNPNIGESHNTIAVAISPLNGTIHLLYDMHAYSATKPSNGSLAEDYFRYSYSVADAAEVPDADFNLSLFVKSPDGDYKHKTMTGVEDHDMWSGLTYPTFFLNDGGELFMYMRKGGNNNGAHFFSKYDGVSKWEELTGFGVMNAKNQGSPYNFGVYGEMKYADGKIRMAFQQRAAINDDKYIYQNGVYYAYSDDQSGKTGWKNHKGEPFTLPLVQSDKIKVFEPGDYVETTQKDKVHMVGSFDVNVTDRGDEHIIARVRDLENNVTKYLHAYRARGLGDFVVTTDFAGGEQLYVAGNNVYMITIKNNRPFIQMTVGGTNNWQTVYAPTEGRTFDKGVPYISDGILYYYLKEPGSGDERTTYLQIIDLDIDGRPIYAGAAQTATDDDGDGVETVTLEALVREDIVPTAVSWSIDGVEVAQGLTASIDLGVGVHEVKLTLTTADDTYEDTVVITVEAGAVDPDPEPEPDTAPTTLLIGWEKWAGSGAPSPATTENGATGTTANIASGWTHNFRGASEDGTFGSLPAEIAAADPTFGTDASFNDTGYRVQTDTAKSIDFIVTETNGTGYELEAFHFDAIQRNGSPNASWTLEILEGGALTPGVVATGSVANGFGGGWKGDVDIDLSSLDDRTLEASSTVSFRLTFESSNNKWIEFDNVGISGSESSSGSVGETTYAINYASDSEGKSAQRIKIADDKLSIQGASTWICFPNFDFGSGVSSFTISAANKGFQASSIELRKLAPDGPLIGSVEILPTGPGSDMLRAGGLSWSDYRTVMLVRRPAMLEPGVFEMFSTDDLDRASGIQDLYLVFPQGGFEIESFHFTEAPGGIEELDLVTIADGFIRGGNSANQVNATSERLAVKDAGNASFDRMSYLKFDLDQIPSTSIHTSDLYLRGRVAEGTGDRSVNVYSITNDAWTEEDLSWNSETSHAMDDTTVIAPDAVLEGTITFLRSDDNSIHTIEVTDAVIENLLDGKLSLIVVDENDGNQQTFIDSRESTGTPPTLHVIYDYVPSEVGTLINAAAYDDESHPEDNSRIAPIDDKLVNVQDGTWVKFGRFKFGSPASSVTLSAKAGTGVAGQVEFRLGSPSGDLIASVSIDQSQGAPEAYQSFSANLVSTPSGTPDLYLVFVGSSQSQYSIESFKFE